MQWGINPGACVAAGVGDIATGEAEGDATGVGVGSGIVTDGVSDGIGVDTASLMTDRPTT